ncbi:MAG: hypothetical protein R3E73_09370 [Porticoccaceae bacterium]
MSEKSGESARDQLASWFASPFGSYLLASERHALEKSMSRLRGYHLMQLAGTENH